MRVKFNPRERQLVKLLIKYKRYRRGLLSLVAKDMHISEQSVKNMLLRLRWRYVEAMDFIDEYRKLRRELATPGRYL